MFIIPDRDIELVVEDVLGHFCSIFLDHSVVAVTIIEDDTYYTTFLQNGHPVFETGPWSDYEFLELEKSEERVLMARFTFPEAHMAAAEHFATIMSEDEEEGL